MTDIRLNDWTSRHRSCVRLITASCCAIGLMSAPLLVGCNERERDRGNGGQVSTPDTSNIGGEAPGGSSVPESQVGGSRVTVTLSDSKIDLPTTVPPGVASFVVINSSTTDQMLKVEGNGVDQALSNQLAPGETGAMEIDLKPGNYQVVSSVDGDAEKGFRTQLTVK